MAIVKTKNIGLTKDDKTEHYSVDRVNANSDLIDKTFGNINETILEGYEEATDGNKSVANFIKFLWKSLTGLKKSVDEYKSAMDECVKALGDLVKKHEKTNKILEFAMGLRDDYEE